MVPANASYAFFTAAAKPQSLCENLGIGITYIVSVTSDPYAGSGLVNRTLVLTGYDAAGKVVVTVPVDGATASFTAPANVTTL